MHDLQVGRGQRPTWYESLAADRHVRHQLSRRAFMGAVSGVTGTVLGAGLLWSGVAQAAGKDPRPTTNVTTVNGVDFHVSFFGQGVDPSCLTDFNGFVGVADVQGTGTATNHDGTQETLLFDTDMRFASGVYVGQDGAVHKGTFTFV